MSGNPLDQFLDRYGNDAVLFVREVFGMEPDQWQKDVLEAVARGERRISVRSGHGVGKSTTLAWLTIWHLLCRYPQKTVCTAPSKTQLDDALRAETYAHLAKLPEQLQELFHTTTERIVLRAAPDDSFVSYAVSRAETPEAIAGKHSENMLIIADEASGIPEAVFEAGSGSMSGHNAVTVLAGNPVRSSGLFYDTHHKLKDRWFTRKVSCADCSRVTPDFLEDLKARYGEDSNAYRVRVLGEFPLADEDTIIPFELMEAALNRDVEATMYRPIWGLDVGRFGSDPSALAKRKGNTLIEKVRSWKGLDTMQLVGRVKDEYESTPLTQRPSVICVDSIGIGAGVADRLAELKLPTRGVNVSESPALGQLYANLRAELWFKGRDWLERRDSNLANDTDLGEELVRVRYKFHPSNGKRLAESKEDMKKRGMPSPNKADAFLLTFAEDAVSAAGLGMGRSDWKQPIRRVIRGLV